MAEIKFEEALKKLEKIVSDLEAGEMSLEESLVKYEEGIKLSKICSRQLEAAKSKVELLMKTGHKFELSPFSESETGEKPKIRAKRSKKSEDSPSLF
ncbi:MAG: exodeoxyribonuclease VII small subunit [Candidatus Omnitrophica bacterium]|nr:exodeoxyribonuclease VII small subunit [Candidatus Omnitrophota bacterium]